MGKQRYKCKCCDKIFINEEDKRIRHSLEEKRLCITLYLNSLSRRKIQKVLTMEFKRKIHLKSISDWIRNTDKILKEEIENRKEEYYKDNINANGKKLMVMEMDELFTHIKKPKNNKGKLYLDKRIWTMVDRNRGRIIDSRVGNDNMKNANLLIYSLITDNDKWNMERDRDKLNTIIFLCTDMDIMPIM